MKYWILFSILCLASAYVVMAFFTYWLFWPVKTLEIKNFSDTNPIKLDQTTVRPGDRLSYTLDYCKYTDIPNTVRRTLIDGQVIILTDTAGKLPAGCHVVTVKTAIIPDTINEGSYYLDVVVGYPVNPLRTEYIHYHTEYFKVVGEAKEPTATSSQDIILTK